MNSKNTNQNIKTNKMSKISTEQMLKSNRYTSPSLQIKSSYSYTTKCSFNGTGWCDDTYGSNSTNNSRTESIQQEFNDWDLNSYDYSNGNDGYQY